MKPGQTPSNRMLLITEARKSLNDIVNASASIIPDHSLIFGQCLVTYMPMLLPDKTTPMLPHISFGHYKLKRKEALRTIEDEEQLYWMTT